MNFKLYTIYSKWRRRRHSWFSISISFSLSLSLSSLRRQILYSYCIRSFKKNKKTKSFQFVVATWNAIHIAYFIPWPYDVEFYLFKIHNFVVGRRTIDRSRLHAIEGERIDRNKNHKFLAFFDHVRNSR